ncbi:MAG: hypothetical protein WBM50_01770, partial [Acidimicrobiales bacterium]
MSTEAELQARITRSLRQLVPGDGIAWLDANRYLRQHLSIHAAAGGLLQDLVQDPGFVVAADPTQMAAVVALADGRAPDAPTRSLVRSYLRLGSANLGHRVNERLANLAVKARLEEPPAEPKLQRLELTKPWEI